MIDGLKPYPAMKHSDVPWLGEVPEHWQLQRMKTLLRERVEKEHPGEPLLAATQSKGVVRKEQYENRTVLALKDLHLLKLVLVGDFVISLRSFQGGIEYAHEQGIISPAYTILYPVYAGTHGYLAQLFKSAPYIENLSLYVTGIRQGQNIDYEKLGRAELPFPPLPEQAAIVRFLNYADRRIRRYIQTKQKLIKLLNEQKQAIIHHAVTRGLDPNVRLKPSGVEWLGEVPEHWEVMRLGLLTSQIGDGLHGTPSYVDESPFKFINGTNLVNGLIVATTAKCISKAEYERQGLGLGPNTLLISINGSIGKLAFYNGERVALGKSAAFLNCNSRILREYLSLVLQSSAVLGFFETEMMGTTIRNLSLQTLRTTPIPLPSRTEQARVVRVVSEETRGLEQGINTISTELLLLREYRTRLMADVVTGKIDVREAARRLPDEAEEPEPLDEIESEGDDAGGEAAAEVEEEEA